MCDSSNFPGELEEEITQLFLGKPEEEVNLVGDIHSQEQQEMEATTPSV